MNIPASGMVVFYVRDADYDSYDTEPQLFAREADAKKYIAERLKKTGRKDGMSIQQLTIR